MSVNQLDTQLNSSNSFASKLSLEQNSGGIAPLNKDFLIGSTVKDLLVGSLAFAPLWSGDGNTGSIQSLANEPAAVPSSDPLSIFSKAPSNTKVDNTTQSATNEVASTSSGANEIVARLNDDQQTWEILEALRTHAIARWASLGIEQADILSLKEVKFQLVDLAGDTLGLQSGQVITLDPDAAGKGWFIDPSPADDSEFSLKISTSFLQADDSDLAKGRVDLLTVIEHEMGHVLGLEHPEAGDGLNHLMCATLPLGVRRIPTLEELTFIQ